MISVMSCMDCDRLGQPDMRRRNAGLLQKKSQEGTQTTMEATLMAQQTPGQREQVLAPDLALLTYLCHISGWSCASRQRGALMARCPSDCAVQCRQRTTCIISTLYSSPNNILSDRMIAEQVRLLHLVQLSRRSEVSQVV